ncbi:hypothetical protein LC609_36610 [Nostoc sp. XA013]|nr:hypothetical protein [Nostoc sp. XA013]
MTKTIPSHTLLPKPKSVIVELSATPEKFLEKGVKAHTGNQSVVFISTSKLKSYLMGGLFLIPV